MKKLQVLYIAAFFAVCLVPFVGMAVTGQESSSENRTLAEFPQLKTEEGINVQWLNDAGEYFQDHFAFRNELVTANALINGKILGTSTASGVIQGTDGWLYYKDSLEDYLGENLLKDRSLYNISHILSLMQEYLAEKNVQFAFTVAPNKNSLYDENMPYYDSYKVSDNKNLINLQKYLKNENVSYVDLYEPLAKADEILYHKRDSHWNNKGAACASDFLLEGLGKEHESYTDETYTVKTDFTGDLDEMLYPLATTPEDEIYYDRQTTFAYVGEVGSNFDPRITTVNPVKTGSLVMYRDSFGNALLPFMADAYGNAYFSRGIPYQLTDVDTMVADTVVVERAERFLPEMAESAPVMPAPERTVSTGEDKADPEAVKDLEIITQGNYLKISGRIAEKYLDTESRIYVRTDGDKVYEAFPNDVTLDDGSTDCGGFTLYLPVGTATEKGNLEILTGNDESADIIFAKD
ncbi:alginate O-acetyltransferase AlgX-related protein [Blautia sp. HCP28S3_G10]|uniref:alginate O-acetyltransferase AlgX-related protein n=1 Tax=Blautia sp. HCP28S3_G10 TaxID=3438908 RepID=UPI003F8CEA75